MDNNIIQQNISHGRAVPVDPEYDKFVDEAAASKDTTTLQNDSTQCALSVLRSFAKHAKSTLDVFSGSLDPQVYDDVELDKYLQVFLNERKGAIRVLIQDLDTFNKISPSPLIFGNISSHPNVKIAFLPLTKKSADLAHFAVVDSSSYRLEVNAAEHQALVSFNDPKHSLQLRECYEALWSRSTLFNKPSSSLKPIPEGETAVLIPANKS